MVLEIVFGFVCQKLFMSADLSRRMHQMQGPRFRASWAMNYETCISVRHQERIEASSQCAL